MRSGLAKPSYQEGPRELYGATTSSSRRTVFCVMAAPTQMADGALHGDVTPAYPTCPVSAFWPLLPAEVITMSPAAVAFCTACTSGSSLAGAKMGWPSYKLTI
jgi:hypothetical protein